MQDTDWTNLGVIGTLLVSSLGSILFYMKHILTVLIPTMHSQFGQNLDNVVAEFRRQSMEERDVLRQELAALRQMFREDAASEKVDRDRQFDLLFGEVRQNKHIVMGIRDRGCLHKMQDEPPTSPGKGRE